MIMEIFTSSKHVLHHPPNEYYGDEHGPYPENPQRIESLLTFIKSLNEISLHKPAHDSQLFLERVHTPAYIHFLKFFSKRAEKYRYPFLFPREMDFQRVKGDEALLGYYSFETATPVGAGTYDAAKEASDITLSAAYCSLSGQKMVYALCRPPGHHAEKERMGGYCYFNNAAVASEFLSSYGKVAILDLDVHHGNGTQSIFYDRDDVLFVSIHGNPVKMYPYFSGFEDEKGVGRGKDLNINLVIDPEDAGNETYQQRLQEAFYQVKQFKPQFLVVSMGYDTHEKDAIGNAQLTTEYYTSIGQQLKGLSYPTLIVQEGGYNIELLGNLALAFVKGLIK